MTDKLAFSRKKNGTIVICMSREDFKLIDKAVNLTVEKELVNTKLSPQKVSTTSNPLSNVTIEIDDEQLSVILFSLGYLAGTMQKEDVENWQEVFRTANRINTGNPNFVQYALPEEKEKVDAKD